MIKAEIEAQLNTLEVRMAALEQDKVLRDIAMADLTDMVNRLNGQVKELRLTVNSMLKGTR